LIHWPFLKSSIHFFQGELNTNLSSFVGDSIYNYIIIYIVCYSCSTIAHFLKILGGWYTPKKAFVPLCSTQKPRNKSRSSAESCWHLHLLWHPGHGVAMGFHGLFKWPKMGKMNGNTWYIQHDLQIWKLKDGVSVKLAMFWRWQKCPAARKSEYGALLPRNIADFIESTPKLRDFSDGDVGLD
jgi:hypothetical protein